MIAKWGIRTAFVIALAAIAGFGVRQYGEARVQAFRAEQAAKASAEAVERFKAQDIADAQTQDKKRAMLDTVRPGLVQARKFNEIQKRPAGAGDDVWVRLFNDALASGNSAIESSQRLP